MFNIKPSMLTMKVKSPRDYIAKLVWCATQCTPMEKGAHESLIFFVISILPPLNMFIQSAPKHKSFLDNYSMFNPPPFIIEFIITLVRLLKLDPSTIQSTHIEIGTLVQPSTM